jgi:hypothetical protein
MTTYCIAIPALAGPDRTGAEGFGREAARERATRRWSLHHPRPTRPDTECEAHPGGCPGLGTGFSFFVSMRADDTVVVLAGPYGTHRDAEMKLGEVAGRMPRGRFGDASRRFFAASAPSDYQTLFGRV